MVDTTGRAESAALSASPQEIQAHRSFVSEALAVLRDGGKDPGLVTQQAGAGSTDPLDMTPAQLASTTLQLARQCPDIVKSVGEKYPEAQPLLSAILSPQMNVPGVLEDDAMKELGGIVSR